MPGQEEIQSLIGTLKDLAATAPELEKCDLQDEGVKGWLHIARTAVRAVGGPEEAKAYDLSIDQLTNPMLRGSKALAINAMVSRNLERMERRLVFVSTV